MAFCPYCGNHIQEGMKFCINCGKPVPEQLLSAAVATKEEPTPAPAPAEEKAAVQVMPEEPENAVCPNCGKVLRPGTKFCNGCGGQIIAAAAEPIPAPDIAEPAPAAVRRKKSGGKAAVICIVLLLVAALAVGVSWAFGAFGDGGLFAEGGLLDGSNQTEGTAGDATEGSGESQIPSGTGTTDPTGTQPTDPEPTDPEPTDPEPTETEPSATEPSATEPPEQPASIAGTWKGSVDMADSFNAGLVQGDPESAQFLSADSLVVTVVMTFGEDGNMTYYIDQESYVAAVQALREDWILGLTDYITYLIDANSLNMSVEEYEAAMGMTVEKLADNMIASSCAIDMEGSTMSTVEYALSGDLLEIQGDSGAFTVKISETELDFLTYSGSDSDGSLKAMFIDPVYYRQQ